MVVDGAGNLGADLQSVVAAPQPFIWFHAGAAVDVCAGSVSETPIVPKRVTASSIVTAYVYTGGEISVVDKCSVNAEHSLA